MDKVRDSSKAWSILRSLPIVPKAGAVMDVDTGEIKVKAEEIAVTCHRAINDQFFGFSVSSGPSQVTYDDSIASSATFSYSAEWRPYEISVGLRLRFWARRLVFVIIIASFHGVWVYRFEIVSLRFMLVRFLCNILVRLFKAGHLCFMVNVYFRDLSSGLVRSRLHVLHQVVRPVNCRLF